jgi:hypothetical protein
VDSLDTPVNFLLISTREVSVWDWIEGKDVVRKVTEAPPTLESETLLIRTRCKRIRRMNGLNRKTMFPDVYDCSCSDMGSGLVRGVYVVGHTLVAECAKV